MPPVLLSLIVMGQVGSAYAAERPITVERLIGEAWQVAGYAGEFELGHAPRAFGSFLSSYEAQPPRLIIVVTMTTLGEGADDRLGPRGEICSRGPWWE